MKKSTGGVLMAFGLAAAYAPAMAEESSYTLSANIGLTSDYLFRGISQTQHQPAIQGGFDFAHASGFYLGAWGSNVEWVSALGLKESNSMELDLYGGFKGSMTKDLGFDVGVITYDYPGDRTATTQATGPTPDTTEVYAGLSYGIVTAKVNYVISNHFVGWGSATDPFAKTRGSYYLDLSGTYDLGGGWGGLGHVGYQKVKDNDNASYTDWKVGVTKDLGFGVATLAYSDTNAHKNAYTWAGDQVANGRVIVSFLKTF
ncbi:MAG: TorF family putative porin [Halothiobacillaceae bacterium]